ncbi:hypothetical protein BDN67DRAFT_908634 [Paxillus ammoniavirescens]|nr:hypothetical protein BDN67DRAFT_908634 [Paxillus ammoniavirescens]
MLQRLGAAYPPKGHWWYEVESTRNRWYNHLMFGKQPDKRKPRHLFHHVDSNKLQYQITADQSCMVRDARTKKIIAIVLRNFCPDLAVLAWVNAKVHEILAQKKSIRLEDPGKIALVGYSAGALNAPVFDWAKNLKSKALPTSTIKQLDFETSSICALFWNMCKTHLPDEVLDDFDDFLQSKQMVRMGGDPTACSIGSTGEYALGVGPEGSVSFKNVELAPPTGVFAHNYCRVGHKEVQPHKFAVAWTTERIGFPEKGGNFYNAAYGLLIESAANTVVVWPPEDVHGTSLQDQSISGDDLGFSQAGLAIVTANRLPEMWRGYRAGLMSQAQGAKEMEESDPEVDDHPAGEEE